jgi:hypothetical protein
LVFKSDNKKNEEQFSQEDISAAYETHGKISENEKNGKSEDYLGWFDKISDFFS